MQPRRAAAQKPLAQAGNDIHPESADGSGIVAMTLEGLSHPARNVRAAGIRKTREPGKIHDGHNAGNDGKYLERFKDSGGKDLKMKTVRLHHHLVPFFGDMPLSKISGFGVERYKRQRLQEAVIVRPRGKTIECAPEKNSVAKPGTVNRELAVLSHLFNMAIEWGWIDRRLAKMKRFQEGQGRIAYRETN
jgi:hypothetical protein